MTFLRWLLLTFGIAFFLQWPFAQAQDPAPRALTPEELFNEGTKLYQAQKYAESAKAWQDLSLQNPDQPELLHNWGLAEYQAGRRGFGVALWRKALNLKPTLNGARAALDFATRAMQLRSPSDQWFERLRQSVLGHVSLSQLLACTLILLAAGGWMILGYLGKRRKALRRELPLPPFSWAGSLLSLAFLLSLGLTLFKAVESYVPRATAISATSVRTGPDTNSSSLFELREGSDVVLRQAKKGWTQIHDPGGMSGWVPNETLYQTSGRPLW